MISNSKPIFNKVLAIKKVRSLKNGLCHSWQLVSNYFLTNSAKTVISTSFATPAPVGS